ncbi:hypothetical protein BDY19DRAFT_522819 [Irpex rosettiformis]|uniref:Uncharacterized protein n=1 Tax=Irpex rosettiformis TaxID=378272 RepID=A0ACB8TRG8_9APHY|nr:hypothetical protein BDY19DRAFT_522819 [Irpex rosettiformis]
MVWAATLQRRGRGAQCQENQVPRSKASNHEKHCAVVYDCLTEDDSRLLRKLQRLCAEVLSRSKEPFVHLLRSEKQPSGLEDTDDAGISLPWHFRHHLHVGISNGQLTGLPTAWAAALQDHDESNHVKLPRSEKASDREKHDTVIYDWLSEDSSSTLGPRTSTTSDKTVGFVLQTLLCRQHRDSCPFRNLDLERSQLVFKKDPL